VQTIPRDGPIGGHEIRDLRARRRHRSVPYDTDRHLPRATEVPRRHCRESRMLAGGASRLGCDTPATLRHACPAPCSRSRRVTRIGIAAEWPLSRWSGPAATELM